MKTSKSSSIQKVSELKRRNGCGWEDNVLDTKGKTELRFLNFIKKKILLRGHKTKYYAKQILNYISKIFRFETWLGEGRGGEFELGGTVSPSHVFVGKNCNFSALSLLLRRLCTKIVSENARHSICL